jgi:hypothetical protein
MFLAVKYSLGLYPYRIHAGNEVGNHLPQARKTNSASKKFTLSRGPEDPPSVKVKTLLRYKFISTN